MTMIYVLQRLPFHAALAAWLVSGCVTAQLPHGGWAYSIYGANVVSSANGQSGATVSGGAMAMAVDEVGSLFFYDRNSGVYRVHYLPPQLVYGDFMIAALAGWVHADRARLLVYDAVRARMAEVGKQPPYPATWAPVPFTIYRSAYDGRFVYHVRPVDSSQPYHVLAVDITGRPFVEIPLATLPIRPVTRYSRGITLGPDGKLLVLDDNLILIDPATRAVTVLSPPPNDPVFYQSNGDTGPTVLAFDPWTNTVAAGAQRFMSSTAIYTQVLGTGVWTLWAQLPLFGLQDLQSTSIRPFELFGRGCANGTGNDPKLGWTGIPTPGQTFSVTVRDAEPSQFSAIWLGLSDRSSLLGPLPTDMAPYGAPGCSLLVSSDDPGLVLANSVGIAERSFAVPANPVLNGFEVFSQAATASSINALGVAFSDAMVIRIR